MKPFGMSLIALGLLSQSAHASDAIRCYDLANGRQLSANQKIELCARAVTAEPLRCYDQATGRALSANQKIALCKSAN